MPGAYTIVSAAPGCSASIASPAARSRIAGAIETIGSLPFEAIDEGVLGYAIFVAERPWPTS